MVDCIIVGAGPAGATAAYHLAKLGRSVLVLEKDSLPRYKPCGAGVSPAIAQWFDFDLSPVISLQVKKIHYTWKMDDPVETELETPMWMVQRDVFDHFLIQQSQKIGAEVRENTTVTGIKFNNNQWQVTTNGETLTSRYLIIADGAKGSLGKSLGFKSPKFHQSFILETTSKKGDVAHFDFGTVKTGYIWAFPKAESYSISIACFRGDNPKNLKQLLIDYATQFGVDVNQSQIYEHSLCLWDGDRKLHTKGALLVGDAACLADPLLGEGIRPSILSGVKAAEAINQALTGDEKALEKYTEIIHQEWGEDMVWAGRLAGLFYRFPGVAYKAAVKVPIATQLMARILCGELRYADVANTAIKRLSGNFFGGK